MGENGVRRSAWPYFGENSPLNPGYDCEMKSGSALKMRQPSAVLTRWQRSFWIWPMESKCSRYIQLIVAFQIYDTRTYIARQPATRSYRAVQGTRTLGVKLGGVWSRLPRRPNRKAQIKGACDGQKCFPDDPQQEGIQEEHRAPIDCRKESVKS